SNEAGIAVSGEITLHADRLYVQVSQSAMGYDSGILFRSCRDRRDYVGGMNNFASLDLLRRPGELARRIKLAGLASEQPPSPPHQLHEPGLAAAGLFHFRAAYLTAQEEEERREWVNPGR